MNMKKIFAGATASVLAVSSLAAAANAYTAELKFADGSWSINSMGDQDLLEESNVVNAEVDKDGTYTVSYGEVVFEDGDEGYGLANGATVFCVDIKGLTDGRGGKGDAAYDALPADATAADKMQVAKDAGFDVTDVKVTLTDADGNTTDVAVDQSKVIIGDIEGNGNLRIELYNEYGPTKDDAPINKADIANAVTVAVTFTVKGVDAPATAEDETPDDTAAPDNTPAPGANDGAGDGKPATNTGIEGVAVVAGLAVLATGAIVIAKKRK
ncbi:MAG: hypothetical protein K2J79_08635 [Ruminiclostridium sp.]|nr:hypothetical protein [Ruminiclostridium sp.]